MIEHNTPAPAVARIEIASVHFDQSFLTVGLRTWSRSNEINGAVSVVFRNVQGFRLLDESFLLSLGSAEFVENGFVAEIRSRGWMDQELSFGNFPCAPCDREFFIGGDNECISVLSSAAPVITRNHA